MDLLNSLLIVWINDPSLENKVSMIKIAEEAVRNMSIWIIVKTWKNTWIAWKEILPTVIKH